MPQHQFVVTFAQFLKPTAAHVLAYELPRGFLVFLFVCFCLFVVVGLCLLACLFFGCCFVCFVGVFWGVAFYDPILS